MRSPHFSLNGASVELGGRSILTELDLVVEHGEAVALVGPSGAGKTTFLRLLNGMVPATTGSVCVGELDLSRVAPGELRRLRTTLGFVHQDHSLVPILRVLQNVFMGQLGKRGLLSTLRSLFLPREADVLRAHELLERVGIPEKLYDRTDTLSGGQAQRVAIARALFQDPAALLADEPVASLDPARGRDILALMTRLANEDSLTLVASLHDVTLARELFPRIIGLREGRVEFDCPTGDLDDAAFAALYELEGLREDGAPS